MGKAPGYTGHVDNRYNLFPHQHSPSQDSQRRVHYVVDARTQVDANDISAVMHPVLYSLDSPVESSELHFLSLSSATPGKVYKDQLVSVGCMRCRSWLTLPSRSSRLAPPPVETWLNSSSLPALATRVAVSPPPTMTVEPFLTDLIHASSKALEPFANAGNSKTPAGPFHRIVLDSATVSANSSADLGPQSRPIQSAGIPDSSVAVSV